MVAAPKSNGAVASDEYQPPATSIFTPRPFKVICVGAGFSGIYLALRMREKCTNVELQIYEKNPEIGGTWWENRYPGAACDVPAQIYAYTFDPNPEWSTYYAGHAEILKYLQRMADKHDVRKFMKFEHSVKSAVWNEESGKWDVEIDYAGNIVKDSCDVFINAGGILNKWVFPKIKGLDTFKGALLHTAKWDDSVQLEGKRVAIVGSGSSSIQVVPQIQPKVKHLDAYIRSPTWISVPWAMSGMSKEGEGAPDLNPKFTPAERERFRNDPAHFLEYRKKVESEFNHFFDVLHQGSGPQMAVRAGFEANMRKSLEKRPDLADFLIPKWDVGCRRLTPGVGYLEALCEDNVEVVRDEIERITPTGLVTVDGTARNVDVLICATGFDVSFKPSFEVKGRNGFNFSPEWCEAPRGYLSLAIEELPNYWVVNGPNACVGNGSLIPVQEKELDYFIRAINKMQRENIKSMCIKKDAVIEFTRHTDAYMPRTSWATPCRSWYKNGKVDGRVTALWPGSSPHFLQSISDPRWEDFDYTYADPRTRYSYMGDGYTALERAQGDNAWYLDGAATTAPLWGARE